MSTREDAIIHQARHELADRYIRRISRNGAPLATHVWSWRMGLVPLPLLNAIRVKTCMRRQDRMAYNGGVR